MSDKSEKQDKSPSKEYIWVKNPSQTTLDETKRFGNIIIPGNDKKFEKILTEHIDSAQEMICISSFLLQPGPITKSLIKADERGCDVFILTAHSKDLERSDELEGNKQEQIKSQIQLLNECAGKIMIHTSPNYHAKYILCDPKKDSSSGVFMTCNSTIDATNGKNIECAFILDNDKDRIRSLYSHFLHGFWEMATHELLKPDKLTPVNIPDEIMSEIKYGYCNLPVTLKDKISLKEKVIELIESAKKEICLTAWNVSHKDILSLLLSKQNDGVNVTIYTRPNENNSRSLEDLVKKGVNIYGQKRIHMKTLLVDGNDGLIMTANFEKLGLDEGFECGIPITSNEMKSFENMLRFVNTLERYNYRYCYHDDLKEKSNNLVWNGKRIEQIRSGK